MSFRAPDNHTFNMHAKPISNIDDLFAIQAKTILISLYPDKFKVIYTDEKHFKYSQHQNLRKILPHSTDDPEIKSWLLLTRLTEAFLWMQYNLISLVLLNLERTTPNLSN